MMAPFPRSPERLTGALLDRLTHHVCILEMNGESHHSAPLASDRSRCYRFQREGMQEFLSPRRLCSNLTGIRSTIRRSIDCRGTLGRLAPRETKPPTQPAEHSLVGLQIGAAAEPFSLKDE
jgi:hypothetical protein